MITSAPPAHATLNSMTSPALVLDHESELSLPTTVTLTLSHKSQLILKRAFDLVGASIGVLLIAPLLLLIALLVRLDSAGPILYNSKRIGRNGVPFYMYKFRTMGTDADSRRDAMRQENNLEGNLFKVKNDPRVTRIGKVLRALSLDELPQLFNVIQGNMSMVGPRPLPEDESKLFKAPYTCRFDVLPGMTGAWQVSGRSNIPFEALCRIEYDYVSRWTFMSDIHILFKTLPAVLASRGAY